MHTTRTLHGGNWQHLALDIWAGGWGAKMALVIRKDTHFALMGGLPMSFWWHGWCCEGNEMVLVPFFICMIIARGHLAAYCSWFQEF